MFLHKLEGLDEPQRLVYAATHGEIIDGHLPHHSLGVNNEQACTCGCENAYTLVTDTMTPTSEGDARLLYEHPVVPGNVLVEV